jgi:hypothetical protein
MAKTNESHLMGWCVRISFGGEVQPRDVPAKDLDDRVGHCNADVECRHDLAILGNGGVVAEPREIERVGNTWQYVVRGERYPGVSAGPGKVVG